MNLNYAKFLYQHLKKYKEALELLTSEIQEALETYDYWNSEETEQIQRQIDIMQENIKIWKEKIIKDQDEEN